MNLERLPNAWVVILRHELRSRPHYQAELVVATAFKRGRLLVVALDYVFKTVRKLFVFMLPSGQRVHDFQLKVVLVLL